MNQLTMTSWMIRLLCLMVTASPVAYVAVSVQPDSKPSSGLVAPSIQPDSKLSFGLVSPSKLRIAEIDTPGNVQPGDVQEDDFFIPGVCVNSTNIGGDEANRLAKEGVLIGNGSENNYIALESGNILLSLDKDVVIGTDEGKICIKSGAMVFIAKSDTDVVVYDLLQTQPKQVSVILDKNKLDLEPGRMLVLTRQNTDDFEKLEADCHRVVCTNSKRLDLHNDKTKAFVADFSIVSALVTIRPVKRLIAANNRQDRLVYERLVKSAAILHQYAGKESPISL